MASHTTFKIGGAARLVTEPKTEDEIALIVKKCRELGVRYMAIGNGSNLLVDDGGIDACVILLGRNFSDVRLIDDTTIYAEAGAQLIKVCKTALENGLTGLEFAYGIPGSCGGAAFMNAGAYGGEMKDVLYRCDHIMPDGEKGKLEGDDLNLSYRHSAYYENGCIITGVYLKLKKGDRAEIKAKMDDLLGRRKDKQPLEYPSAGSTFKRPDGYFAGALIEECSLKGASVGGAQVSTKHAGFVINKGGATCKDVLDLCKMVSDTVYKNKGVKLEMEIRVTK
ncbi:MAG: UDP-N-acetylmuramate dehydrogenase [Ruminococcaceae bacterium]|nr:UDP-N-acetylmuramate dehydrogenase [Oscillospiraceae bacterium]